MNYYYLKTMIETVQTGLISLIAILFFTFGIWFYYSYIKG